jgi:hypothetical protein
MNKDTQFLAEAYQTVVESVIKKKHYNEYKKLTKWLLDNKDKHGKKDYEKVKARHKDLVDMFGHEGLEPHEVKDAVTKKKVESNEPNPVEVPAKIEACPVCGDNHGPDSCPDDGFSS